MAIGVNEIDGATLGSTRVELRLSYGVAGGLMSGIGPQGVQQGSVPVRVDMM